MQVEKCFTKALLKNVSNFLKWLPISGQSQLPSCGSKWRKPYIGAKIPFKRKSRPLEVWMGGNSWREFTHQASCTIITAFLYSCALRWNARAHFLWSGFDLLPWLESDLPVVKTQPVLDLAPAPGLLGQLLTWSGPSAGSMIHFLSQHHELELQPQRSRDSDLMQICTFEWLLRFMCVYLTGPVKNK